MQLQGKNVLLGITGGIAAYKTPDLVRKLTAAGATVRVVLTDSAKAFVSGMSLQAVSGSPVHDTLLDPAAEAAMGHIELAKWADILLIAPATANVMAKLACGMADDLLTTLFLATDAQIFIAPAMNQQMWAAPATQRNLQTLEAMQISFIGPASGEQACGDVGYGRMVEPADIVDHLLGDCTGQDQATDLQGKTILITAGPTREPLDPVRYISNHSSGKMGYAMAAAAADAGANVVLVSGPVSVRPPAGVDVMRVETAQQMLDAVMQHVKAADIFIATAAVADYKAKVLENNKIKKKGDELTLTFVKNPDILKEVAALPDAPFAVGFAAESQNLAHYAKSKLEKKKLAMVAANDITTSGLGFNSDYNALHVFWENGDKQLGPAPKTQLARELLSLIDERYKNKSSN
ncbi:bifunctional phosphopantothenoylcysteine decarboxylase/phosphopantothenate--cysteine ligase CoaBC [Salinimonas sp. HHU 13199]|uniref:Coenzyme A biosynthesis bifunctional protein CoaBC n=1 Tax=Salinimonas profundi TaxID=2729140 RepID=A0ABR8LN72_9ALTE|nr:bifunctional phosphopantothenoylcysteine decarboxylase/phosphopantothenate--cysteine ligase CoaBC [Salinimonas profundi]MBD3587639.1 bifunctional phosphopantothenoylcysteine decarboxylase/phosphopantothenate--cysteine ligase CoaBC [Salinimonas profundi]